MKTLDRRHLLTTAVGAGAALAAGRWLEPIVTAAESSRKYVTDAEGERPKPVVAVDNVCAWPNLTVLDDGTIVATIFNRPCHGTEAGDVECWATKDQGATWNKVGTPAPHEPDSNRMNVAAGRANNGDLIVMASGWSNNYPEGKSGAPFRAGTLPNWLSRSSDGGRTWTIDKKGLPDREPNWRGGIPFGDIIQGDDGALRVAIYSSRVGVTSVYRSDDDGRTWSKPAVISEDVKIYEPAVFHLGGGKWLAAARFDGLDLHVSDDDAKTWTHRQTLTGQNQEPGHFVRLKDRRVLLTYGNRVTPKGIDVCFSEDEGASWSEPLRVADFDGDGGYPSSVQLADGRVLTAYYAQRVAAHDRYHMGVVAWDPALAPGR